MTQGRLDDSGKELKVSDQIQVKAGGERWNDKRKTRWLRQGVEGFRLNPNQGRGGDDKMIEGRLDDWGKELKVSDQIRVKAGGGGDDEMIED